MNKRLNFLKLIMIFACLQMQAQDTLTMMTYNLLKYPSPFAPDVRHYEFQKIAAYTGADIIVAQEIHTAAGADSLLMVLNMMGMGNYERAPQFYQFGGDTGNMLFYNADKLTFYSQFQIDTDVREMSHYRLYANDPNLASHEDTTFLDLVGLHLKASTGSASVRAVQCTDLMAFLNALPAMSNVIVGGDFNFYDNDANEPGYGILTDPAHAHTLNDIFPVWERNTFAYADMFTQSTRSFTYPGNNNGSTGGNDDRFDFLFFNDNVLSGAERVTYLPNTYIPFGNDGYHFNKALIDPAVTVPTGTLNALVPDSIAQALFDMSDHLPVLSEIVVEYAPSPTVNLPIKVFLEGAYDPATGLMTNALVADDLLPLQQPYHQAPWNYAGTESVPNLAAFPPDAVDWVLIELRDAANNYMLLASSAALLLQDGSVVDVEGNIGAKFSNLMAGVPCDIVVRHRNHLAVLGSQSVTLPLPTAYDFTHFTSVIGQAQLAEVATGVYALLSGDVNGDGILSTEDYNVYNGEASQLNQYLNSDVNMDKTVSAADFNLYLPNSSWIGVGQVRY